MTEAYPKLRTPASSEQPPKYPASLTIRLLRTDHRPISLLTRHVAIACVLVPVIVGLLRWVGAELGLYSHSLGVALMVVAMVVMLQAVLWHEAAKHLKSESARAAVERERDDLLAELAAEQKRLDALVQQLPAAVILAEAPSGRLVMANEAVTSLWRHPLIPSRSIEEYREWKGYHADGRPYRPEEWPMARALLHGERVHLEEIEIERGDGSRGHIAVSAAPIRDEHGRIFAAAVACQDVTEQKLLQKRLGESEARYRAVAENASDAIVTIDEQSRIVFANAAVHRIFGHPPENLMGQKLDLLMPEYLRRLHEAAFRDYLATGRKHLDWTGTELPGLHREGHEIMLEVGFSEYRANGSRYFTGIIRDLTQRTQLQEALRESERLAAAGRLTASIAHEINNPLEAVTNLHHLLAQHVADRPEAAEYTRLASEEMERIIAITKQTLTFYKDSSQPLKLSLSDVVDSVLDLLGPQIRRRGIRVERRYEPAGDIWAFPGEMRQIFANLIRNAIEAIDKDGTLTLHVFESLDYRTEQRGTRVVVADTGPGMTPEQMRRVAKPFFTTKGEHGTGVGLWVTFGLVGKYGGRISIRSSTRPGCSGTIFSVFLPKDVLPGPGTGADGRRAPASSQH